MFEQSLKNIDNILRADNAGGGYYKASVMGFNELLMKFSGETNKSLRENRASNSATTFPSFSMVT